MNIKIPKETYPFLNLQRTGFVNQPEKFINVMQKEFDEITPFLPTECKNIMDIGCGIAAIDIFLSRHYDNPKLHLLDQDKTDNNIHYGYKANGSFYNSFDACATFLKSNEITNFEFFKAEKAKDIPALPKQDIIISLLSCGYHYPVDFYLSKMYELLSEKGVLILDIREHTPQLETLKTTFPDISIIRVENKAYRICAKFKPKNKNAIPSDIKNRPIPYLEKMRWEAVLKRIPKDKKLIGAEIGILMGDTSVEVLKNRPLVTHIMIDPWIAQSKNSSFVKSGDKCSTKPQKDFDIAYHQATTRVKFAGDRAIIKRMLSAEAVKEIADKSIYYAFLDGDHSEKGCCEDIELWLPKVKPGGWIGGHDYGNKRLPGVKKAVDSHFKKSEIEFDYENTWFVRIKK